ncbi:MAG: hypothetical protein ACR2KZ_23070 [Segetibacter sp.]
MEKVIRWSEEIKNELEQSKIGIICLNRENLQSECILFETGALSKTNDAQVCTFLLDINPAEIKPPLGQFQHTQFNKEYIKKLLHTINEKITRLGEKTISAKDLDEVFELFFPKLEVNLSSIKNQKIEAGIVKRTEREILEEILDIVRTSTVSNVAQLQIKVVELQQLYHQVQNENQELKYKAKQEANNLDKILSNISKRTSSTLTIKGEEKENVLGYNDQKSDNLNKVSGYRNRF